MTNREALNDFERLYRSEHGQEFPTDRIKKYYAWCDYVRSLVECGAVDFETSENWDCPEDC